MTDLIAFLNARLAEDEAAAKAALEARAGVVPPEGNVLQRVRHALPGTASIEDVLYLVWCSALDAKEMMKEPDATEEHYVNKQRHVLEEARTRVALVDPARVLREVAAKRAILSQYEELREQVRQPVSAANRQAARVGQGELEDVLRQLSAVYSDHPDYNFRSLAPQQNTESVDAPRLDVSH